MISHPHNSNRSSQFHQPAEPEKRQAEVERTSESRCRHRHGLTLVEMLVVVAVTVVFMLALTQVFSMLGDGISSGKAMIELNSEMRAVTSVIQHDLDGITATTLPWTSLQAGAGYFEIIEGPINDNGPNPSDSRFGDYDDAIMFTARARGTPFVGRVLGTLQPFVLEGQIESYTLVPSAPGAPGATPTLIQSEFAEIILWPAFEDLNGNGMPDANERLTLHRRVLLIRPDIDLSDAGMNTNGYNSTQFFRHFDLSARFDNGNNRMVANSLADLTKRENRYAHLGAFPYEVNPAHFTRQAVSPTNFGPLGNLDDATNNDIRTGEDVFLGRLLAFDIRVYDPRAPIRTSASNDDALVPGDPGWGLPGTTKIGTGAFVDLNFDPTTTDNRDFFALGPHPKSFLANRTYDTWSFHYEHDGDDTDDFLGVDQGVDGVDSDGVNGVDDVGERETSPPYPVPLRGIQIRIRVYEPDSQTVRQVTVAANFVSE